ncbi:MAG: Maf family protein [Christensenellales bacterium]
MWMRFFWKPAETVMEISRRKAVAVAGRHDEAIIMRRMSRSYLRMDARQAAYAGTRERNASKFSGNWHHVYTGVTVINTRSGRILRNVEKTRVHIVPMTEEEIDAYVATRTA